MDGCEKEMFARWFSVVGLSIQVADDPSKREDAVLLDEVETHREIVLDYIERTGLWPSSDPWGVSTFPDTDMTEPMRSAPDRVPDEETLRRVRALWARELRKAKRKVEQQEQRIGVLGESVPQAHKDASLAERARKTAEALKSLTGAAKGLGDLVAGVLEQFGS